MAIEGNFIVDDDGVRWEVTGWWCRRCLMPLQSPAEIESGLHAGCEVTD